MSNLIAYSRMSRVTLSRSEIVGLCTALATLLLPALWYLSGRLLFFMLKQPQGSNLSTASGKGFVWVPLTFAVAIAGTGMAITGRDLFLRHARSWAAKAGFAINSAGLAASACMICIL